MNKAKMIKGMVKAKKESVMGKLGDSPFDDPMEPWSAKYNAPVQKEEVQIDEVSDKTLMNYAQKVHDDSLKHDKDPTKRSAKKRNKSVMGFSRAINKLEARPQKEEVENLEEDSWLFSYIKSLGYNPKIMSFAQRSKYARSNAFKHYKQSHMERRPGQTAAMEEVEQVDEAGTGLLMHFIKAKGLNPLTMDGNQKHAYARSSEFKIFKRKHQKEEFDRLAEEYGAENLASIVMQIQETSGMGERGDDWNEEAKPKIKKKKLKKALKKLKEELDKADTVTMDIPLLIRVLEYAREDAKTDMDLHKVVENLIKMRDEGTLSMAQYDAIVKIKEDIERIQELKKMPDNMDIDDHITREEKMKSPNPCWKGYQMVGTKKKGKKTVPNCVPEQVQEGIGNVEDSPMSATNSVKAMESAHRKNQMKSARMIKSLYKSKVKENLYDWEKDDKPNAKIVVKGGTTMTGQPRDTIEIEPVLKTRPNQTKPTV